MTYFPALLKGLASKLGMGTRFFWGFNRVSLSKNTYYDRLTLSCTPKKSCTHPLYLVSVAPYNVKIHDRILLKVYPYILSYPKMNKTPENESFIFRIS